MKKLILYLFTICLGISTLSAQTVTGVVTGADDGQPLPGVNIKIKGTASGTITDLDGKYSIAVTGADAVLIFSYVGYSTQEVTVGSQTAIDVTLAQGEDLEEVIIVGYGEKKKSLVTGAISSVSAEDLSSAVVRPEQALQGKAAGVSVLPSSGAPGAGIQVRVRGVSSNRNANPLYIVDGIKSGDITYLNPEDIASIEVLKDAASSAIYGSEGANGVVIINTKQGKAGKSQVEYSFQYGIQMAPEGPKMLDANQYATLMNEIYDPATANIPNPNDWAAGSGTDWYDVLMQNAPMMKHNLSFSGGNEKTTYLVSANYTSQDGIVGGGEFSNFERFSLRLNANHQIKDWLEIGNNLAVTSQVSQGITEDQGHNGVIQSALMMDPTTPDVYTGAVPTHVQDIIDNAGSDYAVIKDGDDNYYGISNWITSGEVFNPMVRLEGIDKNGETKQKKLLGNFYAALKPIDGLTIRSQVGVDIAFQSFHNYSAPYYGNSDSWQPGLTVTKNEQSWRTWIWENYATYAKSFGEHNLSVMAGVSAQSHIYDGLFTSAGPMFKYDPAFAYPDNVRSDDGDLVGGNRNLTRMASVYGRLSYDFANKYILEATFRRDGSSLFGTDNKFGFFPSVSLGWVLTNESFWTIEPISYLKLRGSWGENGSLSNLTSWGYLAAVSNVNVTYIDGTGSVVPGFEPVALANPALQWEKSDQLDIGLDLRALNDRLYFNFDWYKKTTEGLLNVGSPSWVLGANPSFVNAGNIENSGIEVVLGWREKSGDFKYDVSFNFSKVKNEVTYINPGAGDRIGGAGLPSLSTLTWFEEGHEVWYYRGYEVEGIFRDQADIDAYIAANNLTDFTAEPGDPKVVNHEDDGEINEEDMTDIGSAHHDFIYGANINLAYKGLDLNIFLQGASGGKNYIGFMRNDRQYYNRLEELYTDRWTPTNTDASYPRADFFGAEFLMSDLLIRDASYLKIRQIQLGYTLPESVTNTIKLSKVRVYASLNDFFTFTKYPGVDPEVGSFDLSRQGVDFGFYPNAKKVLFGINITF